MDIGIVLGLMSLIVTVAAAVVTLVALLRQFPRRRLEFTTTSEILLPGVMPELERALAAFANPYLLTVELRSASRADITSAMFDGGRALVCRFSDRLLHLDVSAESSMVVTTSKQGFEIEPQLIRPGSKFVARVVAENRAPSYGVQSPLVDIPFVTRHHETPVSESLTKVENLYSAKRPSGTFTLVEFLVVVLIIVILSAIAVPVFLAQQEAAR